MKTKDLIIIGLLFLFVPTLNLNVFSDTIVCCQPDTLKLAYEYDDIIYNDGCDIQINDVLVISTEYDVFVQINPVDSSFNYWLSRYTPHHCPQIPCYFNNYITKITEDGIYSAYEYINIKYQTNFEVIKGDSSDMPILVLPEPGDPPVYNASINGDFEYYNWSNGSTSNYSLIYQPDICTITATNHCGHTYENSVFIPESGFNENQFYSNQKTGTSVHYIDLDPDSTAHYYHGGSVTPYKNILFDINQDNVDDLNFRVEFASSNGGYSGLFIVTPLNGCEVVSTENPKVAMNIDDNCVLNNLFHYSSNEDVVMFKESWTIFSMSCNAGRWQDSDNYLGFRLPVNNDTIYGWMHIMFSTSWGEMNLVIDDYAYTHETNSINQNIEPLFKVYPNPFSDNLTINTQLQNYSIKLLDVFGKCVFSNENLNGNNNLRLPTLPSGIYFLNIESDLYQQTHKIIKQL